MSITITCVFIRGNFGNFVVMLRPSGCSKISLKIQGCRRKTQGASCIFGGLPKNLFNKLNNLNDWSIATGKNTGNDTNISNTCRVHAASAAAPAPAGPPRLSVRAWIAVALTPGGHQRPTRARAQARQRPTSGGCCGRPRLGEHGGGGTLRGAAIPPSSWAGVCGGG